MKVLEKISKFKYDLHPVLQPLDSMNKEVLSVAFFVYYEDRYDPDSIIVSGRVDWQDGVTIFQSEHIEYDDFIPVMVVASAAIAECKEIIGTI